jgi:hypothetical protein
MAHYAFLNENNIVVSVIPGKNENELGIDWEDYYGKVKNLTCKRTSYNTFANTHKYDGTPFRKNYAGIGYSYDETRDAFIAPKPFDSWILNEDTCIWEAPIPEPQTESLYEWSEENQNWIIL